MICLFSAITYAPYRSWGLQRVKTHRAQAGVVVSFADVQAAWALAGSPGSPLVVYATAVRQATP